jgi:hypothetical protein
MAWNLNIICNQPGGSHLFLLPFAAFALAIYVVGLPLLSLWFLHRNKEAIKYDQILRAQLTGDDKATNPHFALRTTFKALYMNYRPGSWYWEFVVCIRKFLIAFCSLMFRATPSFQLAMALLVLFIAYVLQVRTLPYLSHARAVETFREHRQKVAEGAAVHVRIHEDMMARAAYYRSSTKTAASVRLGGGPSLATRALALGGGGGGSGGGGVGGGSVVGAGGATAELEQFYASKRSTFENQVLIGRHTILRNRVASFMFDYNTAEAVLLSSALLINLAGICFDSSRFTADVINLPGRQAEYDSLAFAVIAIMFISIIYFFAALGMDLLLVAAPQTVQSCLSNIGGAGKSALARAKGAAGVKAGAGGGGGGKRLRVIGGVKEEAADPDAVAMHTNALMVASLASGGAGGAAPRDLSALGDEVPDAVTWPAIRAAIAASDRRAKDLAKEVERLRAEHAEGGAEGGTSAVAARSKRTFSPTSASGSKVGDAKDVLRAAAAARSAAKLKAAV